MTQSPGPGTTTGAPTGTTGPYRLRYTAVTDVGRHRKENQDSGYASDRLLVVADGVGGAAYGDVASSDTTPPSPRQKRRTVSRYCPFHSVHFEGKLPTW